MKLQTPKEYFRELPSYHFVMQERNKKVSVSMGHKNEVTIQDLLSAFKGFLVASGFDYVRHIDVRIDDTSHIHSSSDEDPIDERDPFEIATDLGTDDPPF